MRAIITVLSIIAMAFTIGCGMDNLMESGDIIGPYKGPFNEHTKMIQDQYCLEDRYPASREKCEICHYIY